MSNRKSVAVEILLVGAEVKSCRSNIVVVIEVKVMWE